MARTITVSIGLRGGGSEQDSLYPTVRSQSSGAVGPYRRTMAVTEKAQGAYLP
jgi:hypothetical protein